MFWHASREQHGVRIWWHFKGERRRCIGIELGWWHRFCHAGVSVNDEGWNLSLACPPLFFHLSLDGFPIWRPQRKCIATWDNGREFWLTDQRESRVAIFDWKLWINPWSKSMEHVSADPWWVRGVTVDFKRIVIGETAYICEQTAPTFTVQIPMPEGFYAAEFTPQRQTWKPRRWFATVRKSFDINIPKGIPFAGKGENSWDCGDDGLFGMGADGTVEEAIAKVRDTVMERRRRYGSPSDAAIAEAMSESA